mmetsp:Transcript_1266/g.3857  ORF Transcript_1266/g.3857 Transcript_1266/m.3857 type:complete len:393 (-) Transcript_1266:390-1568(-)
MSRSSVQSSLRELGSMPLVGSSRNTTGAVPIREVATQRRRFMPPLSALVSAWRLSVSPSAARTSTTSRSMSWLPRSAEKKRRCSSTVNSPYRGLSCGHTERFWRQRTMSSVVLMPMTCTCPEVMGSMPVMQLMAVVFPAPLWPRSAKSSPTCRSIVMSFTASCSVGRFLQQRQPEPPRQKRLDMCWMSREGLTQPLVPPWSGVLLAGSGVAFRFRQKQRDRAVPFWDCQTCSNQYARATQTTVCARKTRKMAPGDGSFCRPNVSSVIASALRKKSPSQLQDFSLMLFMSTAWDHQATAQFGRNPERRTAASGISSTLLRAMGAKAISRNMATKSLACSCFSKSMASMAAVQKVCTKINISMMNTSRGLVPEKLVVQSMMVQMSEAAALMHIK